MNRDEARTRGLEHPPRRLEAEGGVPWIGPRDSDRGGTWIGVNDRGLVACLLNRYQDYDQAAVPDRPRSRGDIIPRLMARSSVAQGVAWLKAQSALWPAYPPFTLLLAESGRGERIDWPGTGNLVHEPLEDPWAMVTSSFFEPEAVLPWRQQQFEAWLDAGAPSSGDLPAFHVLCPKGKATWAPLMARDVSCTRSITQVSIDLNEKRSTMHYVSVGNQKPDEICFDTADSLAYIETMETVHGK